ncbi:hypothetical protein CVT26_011444, partial [Gymnopilus dilepis]
GLVPGWEKRASHEDFSDGDDDVNGPSAPHNDDDDDESVRGISDNEGEHEERAGLSENAKGPAARQSLAIVKPTTSVPGYVPPETLKKALIRVNKHLPLDLRQPFVEVFTPLLIQLYGTEQPWSFDLSSDRIMEFFHRHFASHHPFSSTTDGRKIILKLAEDVLTTWRNKIGQVTIDYMENTLICELDDSSPEYISAWCHWALSGSFKCRPFYYRTFIDADDITGQAAVKTNIFCHPIIACALGHHLGRINILPDHLKEETWPTGALIMAVQSVSA